MRMSLDSCCKHTAGGDPGAPRLPFGARFSLLVFFFSSLLFVLAVILYHL
jgi:hypothetical protein